MRLRDGVLSLALIAIAQIAVAQTPGVSEVERLKKEIADLRAENQLLRQLITEGVTAPSAASRSVTQPAPVSPAMPAARQVSYASTAGGPPAGSVSAVSQAPANAATHWITASSSKRHNSGCRWFGTSRGRAGGPNEGIPCLKCGG